MTAPLAAPPYALATIGFPYAGLAALAGRAPVGGQRETALACLTLARLAAAVLPPAELSMDLRRERADAARAWLSTLALEHSRRSLVTRAINATGAAASADIADQLEHVTEELGDVLDPAAGEDLRRIAKELRQ